MKLPGDIAALGPCYRLIQEGWATLGEMDHLSVNDVDRANTVLDALEASRLRSAPR